MEVLFVVLILSLILYCDGYYIYIVCNITKLGCSIDRHYSDVKFCVVFFYFPVPGIDFSITQFVRNLGLEHLMDIFEREQVST